MAQGLLTCKVKLEYWVAGTGSTGTWTALPNMTEIPDIGGTQESIEVTTLDNTQHTYMGGLKDVGDSLDFTFLHTPEGFATANGFGHDEMEWKVSLPDGANSDPVGGSPVYGTFVCFKGEPSVRINGAGTNAALYFTLSIKPTDDLQFNVDPHAN